MKKITLSQSAIDNIIDMAWCDKTPFETIRLTTGLSEQQTIKLMQQSLRPKSFRNWRKRVAGRLSKHQKCQTAQFSDA